MHKIVKTEVENKLSWSWSSNLHWKIKREAGDKVTFEEVVFVGGDDVKVGAPFMQVQLLERNCWKTRLSKL